MIVAALGWLNRKHAELREARGLEDHGQTALEAVMTVSAGVAILGFGALVLLLQRLEPAAHAASESRAREAGHDSRAACASPGLHHMTLICSSLDRSTAFYRNLLGMRMVKQTVNEDDQRRAAPVLRRRARAARAR